MVRSTSRECVGIAKNTRRNLRGAVGARTSVTVPRNAKSPTGVKRFASNMLKNDCWVGYILTIDHRGKHSRHMRCVCKVGLNQDKYHMASIHGPGVVGINYLRKLKYPFIYDTSQIIESNSSFMFYVLSSWILQKEKKKNQAQSCPNKYCFGWTVWRKVQM